MWSAVIYQIFALIVTQQGFGCTQKLNKCCEAEIRFKNGAYSCKNGGKNETTVIRTNTNFQKLDNNTQCIDVFDKAVSVFSKNDSTFTRIKNLDGLTKCCPVQYFYNVTKRACDQLQNRSNKFDVDVVKIGLPECEIISDSVVNLKTDLIYNNSLTLIKTGEVFASNQFCLDETVEKTGILRICRNWKYCKKYKCVRKCCSDGKSFVNGSHCKDSFVYGLQFDRLKSFIGELKDNFAIIYGYPGKVYVEPNPSMFNLDGKGNFHNHKTDAIVPLKQQPYCLEHATKGNRTFGHIYFGFLAGNNPTLPTKFHWNRAAMIVSGIFLIFTIVFYVLLSETRKVFGKTLVCFCCSLLFLYSILVYHTFHVNLHFKPTKNVCKIVGFLIIYLGFCSFFWLLIMCYDIYFTFGASNGNLLKIERKKKDFFKFLSYIFYGWGLPLIYTMVLVIFHVTNILPDEIKPDMGVTRCAIEKGNYAEILFRAIPLTVIQIFNLILFVKTVIYILQVKKEIQRMVESPCTLHKKKKFFKRKERFGLVVKLSFTMGVFYLFEVISSFFDFSDYQVTSTIEVIWDFVNCLQGLFIFLIFVCKRRNYDKFKKSTAVERIRKISLSTSRKTSLSTFANVKNG